MLYKYISFKFNSYLFPQFQNFSNRNENDDDEYPDNVYLKPVLYTKADTCNRNLPGLNLAQKLENTHKIDSVCNMIL